MRTIVIPKGVVKKMFARPIGGRAMLVPVRVPWPELQLTEQQHFENALWRSSPVRVGSVPHEDHSYIDIEIPYVEEMFTR
jgi:hypothetical protein